MLNRTMIGMPTPTDAPDSSQKLGLGAGSQIQVGKKILFDDKGTRGGGVGAFKALVASFEYTQDLLGTCVDIRPGSTCGVMVDNIVMKGVVSN